MNYQRNAWIINKKFYEYVFPSILNGIAIGLNQFVDSIVVANLLGSEAMNFVNMGLPLMMVYTTLYLLFGVGGSVTYAKCMGKMDRKGAAKSLSVTLIVISCISVCILVIGTIMTGSIANLLCGNGVADKRFVDYLRILFFSAPLVVVSQTLFVHFPSAGKPKWGSVLNILANGINLVMDVVYIRCFDMDVEGAALATFTGYAVVAVILIVIILMKKWPFAMVLPSKKNFLDIGRIIFIGAAPALMQFCFGIKVTYCIWMATKYGGEQGVTAFSTCVQIFSMVNIFMIGVINVLVPVGSTLYGQKDYKGMKYILKISTLFELMFMVVFTIFFEMFPNVPNIMYNVKDAGAAQICIEGFRIVSLMHIFRCVVIIYMFYLTIIRRNVYAIFISVFEELLGMVILSEILCPIFKIKGLWIAFVLLAVIMLIAILITNKIKVSRSKTPLDFATLLEQDHQDYVLIDKTIKFNTNEAVEYAKEIQNIARKYDIDDNTANLLAMSVEDMCTYAMDNKKTVKQESMDILTQIYKDKIVINFRSLGKPLDILEVANDGLYNNIEVLKKIAKKVEYEYVIGMNQSKVTLMRKA